MSASTGQHQEATPPSSAPSSFAQAHNPIANTSIDAAFPQGQGQGLASPSSAAAVKAAMQARRKSRGQGEGLRPDFVFPKPQQHLQSLAQTQAQTPPTSSSVPSSHVAVYGIHGTSADSNGLKDSRGQTVITLSTAENINNDHSGIITGDLAARPSFVDGENKRLSVSLTNGSLAPPKNQQHLKTHYRTHSRNGSTVTVQDLKQAIAAVSTDLLDLPPLAVLSGSASGTGPDSSTDASFSLGAAIESEDTGEPAPSTGSSPLAISSSFSSSGNHLPAISEVSSVSVAADPVVEELQETAETPSPPSEQEEEGEPTSQKPVRQQGLALHLDSVKRFSTLESVSAPSTPLRDSYSMPLLSPSLSSRPSSMILNRTARDRTNVSVPPFFAYSIPHEFPSPYTSPRLLLPGAAGPTSLPTSPFARKRKHAYHHTTCFYPTSTICIKLPSQQQGVSCAHRLPVGNIPDFEHYEYELENEAEEGEQEGASEQQDQDKPVQEIASQTMANNTAARLSAAEKRMSWASMVTMDEDLATKVPTVSTPAASQPYRPPGSRLRSTGDVKTISSISATNGHQKPIGAESPRPIRRASPTQDKEDDPPAPSPLAPAAEVPDSMASSPSRIRKAAPPPLNLAGNTNMEESKSSQGSPTTPTTPSRRRRSRSRKNNKDKSLDGSQQQQQQPEDAEKESVEQEDSAAQSEKPQQEEGSEKPKKTRTRSRSRSRSRSRNAQTDNGSSQGSSNESVPPVPQTPSWVPAHNMTLASAGPVSASIAAVPVLLPIPAPIVAPLSPIAPSSLSASVDPPMSPTAASAPRIPLPPATPSGISSSSITESELKRRGPRPARLLSTRSTNNLQTLSEGGQAMFSPRSARDGPPSDYFSMRPLQHPPRTPMTPGGDYDDDDDYYGRLQMVTTPMIQNGFFPNWAKGDAQLEELERIRLFLSARQYPDEMPLSDEWTLFFSDTSRAKDKSGVHDAYSSAITPLFSCHTVPQFATSWKYVRDRVRPATMKVNQNLHWFKKGIKPMWEDPKNKYGGRLTLCPPRALLDIVWETVLILMAGDVLDHHGEGTGAVFARRARGDRVEVWLGADDTPEALAHIRGVLTQELAASGSGADELVKTAKYKKHFDGRREERLKQAQLAKEAAIAAGEVTPGVLATPGASSTPAAVATATAFASAAGGASATARVPLTLSSLSCAVVGTPTSVNGFHGLSSPLLPMTPRMNGSTTPSLSEFQSFEAFTQHQQQQQMLREREREREREKDREVSKEQERIMQLGKERLEKERAERDRLRDEKVRAMAAAAMAASEAKHQQQLKDQRERERQQQQQLQQ